MHVIRLRGPWQYRPLARTVLLADGTTHEEPGPLPRAGRIHMPCDWGNTLGHDFRGRVIYTRRFHRPTGLERGDSVMLVFDQIDALGRASLNGRPLGEFRWPEMPARFDVTRLLEESNELTVEVELPRAPEGVTPIPRPGTGDQAGGLTGEVRLEIHTGGQSR